MLNADVEEGGESIVFFIIHSSYSKVSCSFWMLIIPAIPIYTQEFEAVNFDDLIER